MKHAEITKIFPGHGESRQPSDRHHAHRSALIVQFHSQKDTICLHVYIDLQMRDSAASTHHQEDRINTGCRNNKDRDLGQLLLVHAEAD